MFVSFLNVEEIKLCRLVCKSWNTICCGEDLWKKIFLRDFYSDRLLGCRSMLCIIGDQPNGMVWYSCCIKLQRITNEKRLRDIMTEEDRNDISAAITVLLYLDICCAYIGFPHSNRSLPYIDISPYRFTHQEIYSFVIRYNIQPFKLSKRLSKSTVIHRKFSDSELVVCLCTILNGKIRMQLYILRETLSYICGNQNGEKITMDFIKVYPKIFYVFQKKVDGDNNADTSWILLRSQQRFIVTDKESLFRAVYLILWEHPKGIRIEAFRTRFEKWTGLPFGLCSKQSLSKYFKKHCDVFLVNGTKLNLLLRDKEMFHSIQKEQQDFTDSI